MYAKVYDGMCEKFTKEIREQLFVFPTRRLTYEKHTSSLLY